jgi:hypothetical protein
MPPERPDLVLAADVPDVELDILHRHRLDVEADRRDGRDGMGELERVEDRRLAGGVEAEHQDADFPGPPQLVGEEGEDVAHLGGGGPCGHGAGRGAVLGASLGGRW